MKINDYYIFNSILYLSCVFFILLFTILCMHLCLCQESAHESTYAQGSEVGTKSPGVGVTGSYELSRVGPWNWPEVALSC